MNENAKNVYDNLIANGIMEIDAKETVLDLFGEDPTELKSASVRVQVSVVVELDYAALEGLTAADEVEILSVATSKVENELQDTYGDMEIDVGWGEIESVEA